MNAEQGRRVDNAINLYHCGERNYLKGLEALEKSKVAAYIEDPSTQEVISESIQAYFKFQVEGVWFSGMIDQIRHNEKLNRLEVWDIKFSDLPPYMLCNLYVPSLIVYSYAFGVHIGGIINVNNYNTKDPVFHHLNFVDNRRTTKQDVIDLIRIIKR